MKEKQVNSLARAYLPDGAILFGDKGPVTNLGCGDIYDWSTGLIYKNGRYFDPTLGIWLALAPLVIGGGWFVRGKRGRRKEDDKRYVLPLLLLLLAMGLSGCGDTPTPPPGTPTPDATQECPPTPTPSPTPSPPPFVDDWDLKLRTVQITRVIHGSDYMSLGTVVEDTSVRVAVMPNEERLIKHGDSGGGLFHNGKLVGNTWAISKDHTTATSALLLP